ncbi:hypothetical protein H6775_01430 [Candidatus Nomurabacteria bacterium]|nr:hypothetical protein [Candidatus Nomurabacteria bacterium]
MYNTYILNQNKQDSDSGNNYELHNQDTCEHLPALYNRLPVGVFKDCQSAKAEAKRKYPYMSKDIDGCFYCCRSCHTE